VKVKSLFNPQLMVAGSVAALVATASPAFAAQTEVTAVRLNPTPTGMQLLLNIQGNSRPPVFTVNRGNSSVVDIADSQLRLPTGGSFTQANPVPGIRSIEVRQLDANTVRVTVNGIAAAPIGEVVRRNGTSGLVLNFARAQQPAGTVVSNPSGQPGSMGQTAPVVPPYLPRAVAPPVGDIAIGPVSANPEMIRLDSNERIPRLLLREAPVREVLALLARAASINVVFPEEGAAPGGAAGASGGQTISLDIENESVQDVFNYVLRASGLQANRVGRTIFVGKNLPPDAQNRIVRTLRLNQIRATSTSTITTTITSQAETGGSVGGPVSTNGGGGGSTATARTALNRTTTTTDNINQRGALEILQAYGANGGGSTGGNSGGSGTLLAGLEVVADARTNTITLIGTPRKVETATTILTQLDVRKRQALINVKIVDINLLNTERSNLDLQTNFGNGLFGFVFGPNGMNLLRGTTPFIQPNGAPLPAALPSIPGVPVGQITSNFFANLELQIRNDNAKVLTNPTLLVQEGSAAQVNLTQEIFSGVKVTTTNQASGSGAAIASSTVEPIIRPAGVIFNVTLERIDDNGFLTLNMSPEVSAPSGTVDTGITNSTTAQGRITLLQQRRLETGNVRLRDGDTMLLSGIIQDTDRSTVSKVPILGDIPLLGRLFRREENSRNRNELVIMVTPRIQDDSQANGFGYQYSPRPGNENLPPR
jgi:type IV pilus assembly protein PilQ